jgi:hypothetical protein
MSGKRIWLASLVVVLLGLRAARAQAPGYGSSAVGNPPANPVAEAEAPFVDFGALGEPGARTGPRQPNWPPSEWLLYPRSPGCCGPVGLNGPINTEVFLRSGIIWPFGGSDLVQSLNAGWEAELGGRVLFFDPSITRAWTVGLSISNIYNQHRTFVPTELLTRIPVRNSVGALAIAQAQAAGQPLTGAALVQAQQNTTPVTLVVPSLDVTVRSLNQTFVNFFGGREWYLMGSGNCSAGCSWRAGVDIGGSWGSADLELNEIRHRTGVDGGIFINAHTDIEVPFHCAILSGGILAQYGYIWTDLLQINPADFQYFGLLLTAGVRF